MSTLKGVSLMYIGVGDKLRVQIIIFWGQIVKFRTSKVFGFIFNERLAKANLFDITVFWIGIVTFIYMTS
jgi:hypothetical protein